jgi:chemotaxis methyl-accepting protein methylase
LGIDFRSFRIVGEVQNVEQLASDLSESVVKRAAKASLAARAALDLRKSLVQGALDRKQGGSINFKSALHNLPPRRARRFPKLP